MPNPIKGIILSGGKGSRLFPSTVVTSKQLLPVYDKPMIYYPLTTLMLAGVRDFLIITNPHNLPLYEELLGDGSQWGIKITYEGQERPTGLPDAFVLAEEWLAGEASVLMLGDNIIHGAYVPNELAHACGIAIRENRARCFLTQVQDPQRYGICRFDEEGDDVKELVEKPADAKPGEWAITGLYVVGSDAPEIAKSLKPSARGETEIIDLLNCYLVTDRLYADSMSRGIAWFDAGNAQSLLDASSYVHAVQSRQGVQIACPEEAALIEGWITKSHVADLAKKYPNDYGRYLEAIAGE